MKRLIVGLALFAFSASPAPAQSLDDLSIQIHGFATQSFVLSARNNWNTLDTSDGSAAWTEAVVNITAQPESRLRIGVQARYLLLGTLNNAVALDWADADYKVDERFGVRVGKVKTPAGLLNETQDVDPGHLWVLLPSSIYAIASRNSVLSHYGGVGYGSLPLGSSGGTLRYDLYGGQRVIDGTELGYSALDNTTGLSPNARMALLKLGMSF